MWITGMQLFQTFALVHCAEHIARGNSAPLIKNRNFDPESRTLKKHQPDDIVMEDTVENLAQGMAAQIIIDDEKRRTQELVCYSLKSPCSPVAQNPKKGCL